MNPMVLLLERLNLDMPGRRTPASLGGRIPSVIERAAHVATLRLHARGLPAGLEGTAMRAKEADRG